MKRFLVAVLFFGVIGFCLASEPLTTTKSLVRLEGVTHATIVAMADKGFDIARAGFDFVEVVLNQDQIKAFAKLSPKSSVLITDLDKYVSDVLASQKAGAQYFTYDTMTQTLKDYVNKYPNICKLNSIGKSCEGRDIWAFKISKNPTVDEKEPRCLIMGDHHAREWISVEVPMATIKMLLEGYGKDERLTRLVDTRECYFVPMVNPDGMTYSQTKEKFWRKNRRKNSDGTFGVDPNRNYGYKWGGAGASTNPSDDTYRGPSGFSEPETQAIRDFAQRMQFSADITFHSYAELILYPWSYATGVTNPDEELFKKFANELAKFNNYTAETSSEMYPSSGDADDFMYGVCKSLSFTFELAKAFIPAPTEIAGICDQNVPAVLYLIEKSGTYGLVTPGGAQNIPTLDTFSAISALKDLEPLSHNDIVADRIQATMHMLAQRVVSEEANGESQTLLMLQQAASTDPSVQVAFKLANQCRTFEKLHSGASKN
ncbi:MAG: zinc carboxypeptidase [Candidatus Riflebacteria bacterium]|nr:zinc carboxypeptidase [Candidatus Riflebacteria bacterium]